MANKKVRKQASHGCGIVWHPYAFLSPAAVLHKTGMTYNRHYFSLHILFHFVLSTFDSAEGLQAGDRLLCGILFNKKESAEMTWSLKVPVYLAMHTRVKRRSIIAKVAFASAVASGDGFLLFGQDIGSQTGHSKFEQRKSKFAGIFPSYLPIDRLSCTSASVHINLCFTWTMWKMPDSEGNDGKLILLQTQFYPLWLSTGCESRVMRNGLS